MLNLGIKQQGAGGSSPISKTASQGHCYFGLPLTPLSYFPVGAEIEKRIVFLIDSLTLL